jgi:hypothetical protein
MNRNYEANILQNMGKTTQAESADQPKAEDNHPGYSTSQTFLRIKVCSNCSLPYDGEFCMRCTEGRILAEKANKNRATDPDINQQPQAESQKQTGQQLPKQGSDTKLEDGHQQQVQQPNAQHQQIDGNTGNS